MIYCQHCTRPTARRSGPCPHCGKSLTPSQPSRSIEDPDAETQTTGSSSQSTGRPVEHDPSVSTRRRLGEILLDAGYVSLQQLNIALEIQEARQVRLGSILLKERFVSEDCLIQALSHQFSIPWVILERISISNEVVGLIPADVAEQYLLFPVYKHNTETGENWLYLAMNDPKDGRCLKRMASLTGMTIRPMVAGPSDISKAILRYYRNTVPAAGLCPHRDWDPANGAVVPLQGGYFRHSPRSIHDPYDGDMDENSDTLQYVNETRECVRSPDRTSEVEGRPKHDSSAAQRNLTTSVPAPFPLATDGDLDSLPGEEAQTLIQSREERLDETARIFTRPGHHPTDGSVVDEQYESVPYGDSVDMKPEKTPTIIPSPDRHWKYEEIADSIEDETPDDSLSVWNIALARNSAGLGWSVAEQTVDASAAGVGAVISSTSPEEDTLRAASLAENQFEKVESPTGVEEMLELATTASSQAGVFADVLEHGVGPRDQGSSNDPPPDKGEAIRETLLDVLQRNRLFKNTSVGGLGANWEPYVMAILEILVAKGITDLEEFFSIVAKDSWPEP